VITKNLVGRFLRRWWFTFEFATEGFEGRGGGGWVCDDEVAGGFEGALFFPSRDNSGPNPGAAAGEVGEEGLVFVVDDAGVVAGLVDDEVGG